MVRQTGDSIIAVSVRESVFARNNLHILLPKTKGLNLAFILGVLNSRLMDFCYSIMNPEKGEALAEVKKQHVENLPAKQLNMSEPAYKSLYEGIVSLVEQMLELNKQLPKAKTEQDKTVIQRQIEGTDREIDKLVYELYGLTEEEVKVVEGK
jgi:hypothetical protein